MKIWSVTKKVALFLMVASMAVATIACQGAAGLQGEPGEDAPAPKPVPQPPYVVLALSDLPAIVEGMTDTLPLSGAFGDPDGTAAALTLTAKSNDTAIATAKVSGTTLTVVAVKVGTTAVVVTATDADDLKVSQSVQVTVIAAPPEPDPPVTIADVIAKYPTLAITPTTAADASMEIELPAEHTLISENSAVVTVAKKAAAAKSTPTASIQWASATADDDTMAMNVWVVTAESRGVTNVDVLDNTGVSVHTIRVTVTADPPPPPVPPVAPTVKAGGIGDRTLYLADDPMAIVLTTSKGSDKGYFTHESAIDYVVSANPTGYVEVSEANGTLTLKPLLEGATRVTIVATADSESTDPVTFRVTVETGSMPPPTAAVAPTYTQISKQTLFQDESAQVDLAMHFRHANDSTITYAPPSSSPTGIVKAAIAAGTLTLTLTPVIPGFTTVTVVATAEGESVEGTFTVEVKAGNKPAPPPPPPPDMPDKPVATEEMIERDVDVKETKTIDASMYFTPNDGLEFSIEHDDNDKLTATVDATSGMVTITGVDVGGATITVTATNVSGSANLSIEVTVNPEGTPHIDDDLNGMVEIGGVGDDVKTADVRFDAGQRLQSLSDKVDVEPNTTKSSDTANVWTITGKEKTGDTPAMVRVWREDGSHYKDISVTVANTAPKPKDDPPKTLLTANILPAELVDEDGKEPVSPATLPTLKKRAFHKIDIEWKNYFDDDDGFPGDINDKTGYKAVSGVPEVDVITTLDSGVVVDVKALLKGGFPLVIHVVDEDSEESDPVRLQVAEISPLGDVYEVSQLVDSAGGFSNQDVWLRKNATHKLTFADYDELTTTEKFRFVQFFRDDLLAKYAGENEGADVVLGQGALAYRDKMHSTAADAPTADEAATGASPYYLVSPSSNIKLVPDSTAGNFGLDVPAVVDATDPTLMFEVTGSGRATVKITYYVPVRTVTADDSTATPPAAEWEWKSDSRTLTMNIVP